MKIHPHLSPRETAKPSIARRSLLIVSILSLAACSQTQRIETSGAGHAIVADIEGNHSVESHATHAAISSQFGGVTIEQDRARIDGVQWTKIPEKVPVTVSISKHTLSIKAGNVTIARTVR